MQRKVRLIALAVALAAFLMSCVSGPGEIILQPVKKDKEIGLELAKHVATELGIVDDQPAADYVTSVYQNLVRVNPDKRFDYNLSIVDQYEPNAFSLPGGYIYVSRGLLALTNSESELANVLAHEVIHVSHRHSAKQMAQLRIPSLLTLPGKIVGSVISENLGNLINAPVTVFGLAYISRYSQSDEYESDHGGQELAARAGYDPKALGPILKRLERFVELETGEKRIPGFFDTHPSTPDRAERVANRARELTVAPQQTVVSSRDEHVRKLDGLLVGENPAAGVFQKNKFLHTELGFSMTFPVGWKHMNTPQVVFAVSPKKDASLALGITGKGTDLKKAALDFSKDFKKKHRVDPVGSKAVQLGDIPAHLLDYSDTTGDKAMHLYFLFIAYRGFIYQLIGIAPEQYHENLRETALSFRSLSAKERASVNETRLRIVSARANETLERLAKRTGNVWDDKTTAVVNGLKPDQVLKKGQLVKIAIPQPYKGP